jgi:hypothetical protein
MDLLPIDTDWFRYALANILLAIVIKRMRKEQELSEQLEKK